MAGGLGKKMNYMVCVEIINCRYFKLAYVICTFCLK